LTAIVFVGPTLSTEEVGAFIDAECRPPAAQGDVYRAALERPRCIGIVDGYFDGVPSVWHKEILWAMAQGIEVFGSASMGALRAAELCAFGMKGVGRIFEDFRDGRLEDDDEVAVLHAPAELGFKPLSEPMVSIRATADKAAGAGVLTDELRSVFVGVAKAIPYRDRTWDSIVKAAEDSGVDVRQSKEFQDWLATGRVDAKREDAVAMLKVMASAIEADEPAGPVGYEFEWTDVWNSLTERVGAEGTATGDSVQLVLDELRLDEEQFQQLRQRAALRQLALDQARRQRASCTKSELVDEMSRHRTRNRLMRRQDLTVWLDSNQIDERDYENLLSDNLMVEAGSELPPETLARHIVAELKWSGDFASLRRRALDKARVLGDAGRVEKGPGQARPNHLNLVVWHFEQRLDRAIPEDLDAYARSVGLGTRQELYRVLEREYLYSRLQEDDLKADPSD
jgi:hypothetical protein